VHGREDVIEILIRHGANPSGLSIRARQADLPAALPAPALPPPSIFAPCHPSTVPAARVAALCARAQAGVRMLIGRHALAWRAHGVAWPGADNDMPQGFTPLMVASAKGHVHSMLLLIDRGAKIDAVNDLGQTALHLAAQNGHAHAVKCLVAEGAESWHRDNNGSLPMDCAKSESEEHERCRLILEMAKPRGKVKVKVQDSEDVDGDTPAHHYLVQSFAGLPRSCASNGVCPNASSGAHAAPPCCWLVSDSPCPIECLIALNARQVSVCRWLT